MSESPLHYDMTLAGAAPLLPVFLQKAWWIVASVIIGAASFAAFAFLSTPIYRSSVVLMPTVAERNSLNSSMNAVLGASSGLGSILGVDVGRTDPATEEALAVLRSREFSEAFISDKHLIRRFFPGRWDDRNNTWKNPDDVPTPAKAFKYFDTKVRYVEENKKTGLVSVQIDWRDRNEASQWANELVQRLNMEMRQRAIDSSDASVSFLERELNRTTAVETREAVNRLIEAQVKQRMIADVTQQFAFRVVDKAMPADADDPIRPRKAFLTGLGAFLGLALSLAAIAVYSTFVRNPKGAV